MNCFSLFVNCTLNIDDCPSCVSGEVSCPLQRCKLEGLCQGTLLLPSEPVASHKMCQNNCASSVDCSFYSFDYETYYCHMYTDCPELNVGYCPRCVSGQPGCGVDQFLMVMGGYNGITMDGVELVSLNEEIPVLDCLLNFGPLPDARYHSSAGLFPNGNPTVCGGRQHDPATDVTTSHSECFEYLFALGIWHHLSDLPPGSAWSDTAWAYDDKWGLVMAGGRNESSTLKSVMRTKDGIFFEELPDLPVGSIEACLVIINDTHLFLAGGLGASTMTYMFDGSEWFEAGLLPGSEDNRRHVGCGTAVNSEGQQEVVVAGGYDEHESASEYEVDILNLVTGEWKTSENALPQRLWSMASVPYKDSFLLVGGYGSSEFKDSIYEFDPKTEQFRPVVGRVNLQTARRDHAALMVDVDSFPECI